MSFDDYITDEAIFRLLARLRVRIVKKRHTDNLYWRLGTGAQDPSKKYDGNGEVDSSVSACLPSRKVWGRAPRKARARLQQETVLERGIVWAIRQQQSSDAGLAGTTWGRNLLALLEEVRSRAAQASFVLQPPKLLTIAKNATESRCLAKYEKLSDRIILIQMMKYIRDQIDDSFSSCSYAFRRSGEINHITAIRNLQEYRLRYPDQPLYVAECDVMGFFDVINHEEVMAAYDTVVQQLDSSLDSRARQLVAAYLDSYSSFRDVSAVFSDPEERRKIAFLNSPELKVQLKHHYGAVDPCTLPLGLPQGGALSPILINLVMDCVDRAVLDGAPDDLFYARYCDDMIIAHPDKKVCAAAFERYLVKMDALRLPIHKVYKRFTYGKGFYGEKVNTCKDGVLKGSAKKIKSKGPYAWAPARKGENATSPWVSFLGQQIRFDGEVRIRKESLEKHRARLHKEVSRLVRACGKHGNRLRNPEARQEAYSLFRQRLVALGVGYCSNALRGSAADLCWLAAFPGITPCTWTIRQMRLLDREREAVLCNVRHGPFALSDGEKRKIAPKFLGKPFSYLAYLERVDRLDLRAVEVSTSQGEKTGFAAYGEW